MKSSNENSLRSRSTLWPEVIFLMERLGSFIVDGLISLMMYSISEKAFLYFMSSGTSFSLKRVSPSF